jgi:hypothetical protein
MDAERPDDTRTDSGFAAMWSSDGVTRSLAPTATGLPADLPFLFTSGQHFGPYLIVRPIGKGGMGQVYEAEETDSGRRVAVKILSRGIGDDEERERFLQEGRLAASLSHPNTVYVFGTGEVQGFPVIAMELAPSGTLKDLVVPGAPMAPAKVVDAILQVIAGLEAAAAIGILHRDVKPSNCFVGADGRVLVGDFGLSIATLARSEGSGDTPGTILGTPGFASPEQLRGDRLDVRSDIYSVGATVYYLLSGKAPFDDSDLRTIMTRVATELPPALSLSRPDLPSRFGGVVMKCLAKTPGDRYASYAALRSALEPFRSASLTPAPLARRFFAGFVDSYIAGLPAAPINMYLGAAIDVTNTRMIVLASLPALVMVLAYYAVLEGRFGCGAGKAIFNLRVVDLAEGPPGWRRALARALVFAMPAQLLRILVAYAVLPGANAGVASGATTQSIVALVAIGASLLIFGVQFSTVRRRNGYAALHDLASGTRVVLRPRSREVRAATARTAAPRPTDAQSWEGDRVGPYLVPRGSFARVRTGGAPVVVEGFDDRLRRPVWVELLPEGTPPVPGWRRDLGRATRLRWLSGRRQGGDCWDAYEAVDGVALTQAIAQAQPWSRVRHWTAELASEVAVASKDGSLPLLAPDRVWIDGGDRARLLDWSPPAAAGGVAAPGLRIFGRDLRTSEQVLHGIASGALRGRDPVQAQQEPADVPLPLGARAFLQSLRDGAIATPEALEAGASDLLRGPARLSRGRRAAQLAVCAFIPVIMPVAVIGGLRTQLQIHSTDTRASQYDACVSQLASYAKKGESKLTAEQKADRESIEIFIAEHLQDETREAAAVARSFPVYTKAKGEYVFAERAIAKHPTRTPQQVKRAEQAVAKLQAENAKQLMALRALAPQWALALLMTTWTCAVIGVLALVGALATRSGFSMRAIGAALVNSRGEEASRLRALWRTVVSWLPIAAGLLLLRAGPDTKDFTIAMALLQTLPLVLFAAGAAWAIRHPSRGLQDWLAGTWIVPR